MAKKISYSDIHEDSLFKPDIEEAKALLDLVNRLIAALKDFGKTGGASVKGNNFGSSEEIASLVSEISRLKQAYTELQKMTEAQAKAQDALITAVSNEAKSIRDLNVTNAKQVELLEAVSGSLSQNIKLSSQYAQILKDIKDQRKDLNREFELGRVSQDQYANSLAKLKTQENEVKLASRDLNSAITAQTKEMIAAEGSFDEAAQRLGRLKDAYRTLSQAERENIAIGGAMLKSIQQLDVQVKRNDASIGNFQRNVGNYSGGFRQLEMSLSQLAGTIPAFASSFKNGLLDISNQLPQVASEISRLIKQNKELVAQGKPTQSVFKTITSSIFSFTTGVGIATTVLAVFGDEIMAFVKDLFSSNKAFDEQAYRLKTSAELTRAATEATADEVSKIEQLLAVATNEQASREERNKAVRELNLISPEMLGNLTLEKIGTNEAREAIDKYVESLNKKARAQAFAEKMADLQRKRIDAETAAIEDNLKSTNNIVAGLKRQFDGLGAATDYALEKSAENRAETLDLIDQEINALKRLQNEEIASGKITVDTALADAEAIKLREQAIKDAKKVAKERAAAEKELYDTMLKEFEDFVQATTKAQDNYNDLIAKNTMTAQDYELYILQKSYEKQKQELEDNFIDTLQLTEIYEQRRLAIKQRYVNEQVAAEQELFDTMNKEFDADAEKRQKEEEKAEKKRLDDQAKARKVLLDNYEKFEKDRLDRMGKRLDNELAKNKDRQDQLREQAMKGFDDASASLALEQKKEAQLQAQKDKLEERKRRQELALAALKAYSAKLDRGEPGALTSTIKDLTSLAAAVRSIPGFIEGTERVADDMGDPTFAGRDGYIARFDGDEGILKPAHNKQKLKLGLTNADLIDLATMHSKGLLNMPSWDASLMLNRHMIAPEQFEMLADQVKRVEDAIVNRPVSHVTWGKVTEGIVSTLITALKTERTYHNKPRI